MDVERINPKASRRDAHYNLMLLHRYCKKERDDELHRLAGTYDKRQRFEEPYEGKPSRTVLKPRLKPQLETEFSGAETRGQGTLIGKVEMLRLILHKTQRGERCL
jgi:hypothetical protein